MKPLWESSVIEHNAFENATTWLVSVKADGKMILYGQLRYCSDTRSEDDFVFAANRMLDLMNDKVMAGILNG